MFRVKIITTAAIVVCTLSILAATPASANWFVGGTELKTSAALETAEVIDEPSPILVPTLGLALLCTGGILDGVSPEIIAGNSVKAEAFEFLDCNVTAPPTGCSLREANQTIPTYPITAKIFLGAGKEDKVTYSAQTKNVIAEVEFSESNTCAFEGIELVDGSITVAAPAGQLEAITETLVGLGSVENNSLEVGKSGAKIFLDGGRALIKLASNSKWSFK